MRRPKGAGEESEQRVSVSRSERKKVGQKEKSMKMRSVMVVSSVGGGGGGADGGGGRERVEERRRRERRGMLMDVGQRFGG